MNNKRTQLTLFIAPPVAEGIENIRKHFNPLQYELIPAHVTLCREEELEQLDKILQCLNTLHHSCITIHFGKPVRFAAGKGLMIPALQNNAPFQQLRYAILKGLFTKIPKQEPHITLMHPRNATCTDELFEQIQDMVLPRSITFNTISLIEQEPGKPWQVRQTFMLH